MAVNIVWRKYSVEENGEPDYYPVFTDISGQQWMLCTEFLDNDDGCYYYNPVKVE